MPGNSYHSASTTEAGEDQMTSVSGVVDLSGDPVNSEPVGRPGNPQPSSGLGIQLWRTLMSNSGPDLASQISDSLKRACTPVTMVEYPPKTSLFPQGEMVNSLFLIVAGLIKLTHVDADGKEIIVGVRGPGWLLGVTAALLNRSQPTGATTLTHCRMLRISKTEINRFMDCEPTFSEYLLQLQAQEVHDHLVNAVELASHSTEYRLVKLLTALAFGIHSFQPAVGRSFPLPLKQWEIAQVLAVTPEHICRLFRRLERLGLVLRKGQLLFISDPQELLSVLNGCRAE